MSRFKAVGDVAVAGSETVLIEFNDLSAGYHNGGGLVFKDGKLFITTGENTVGSNAQTLSNLLGKVCALTPTAPFRPITCFTPLPLGPTAPFGPWAFATPSGPPCSPAPAGYSSTTWALAPGKK